jgi:hypothetical protein
VRNRITGMPEAPGEQERFPWLLRNIEADPLFSTSWRNGVWREFPSLHRFRRVAFAHDHRFLDPMRCDSVGLSRISCGFAIAQGHAAQPPWSFPPDPAPAGAELLRNWHTACSARRRGGVPALFGGSAARPVRLCVMLRSQESFAPFVAWLLLPACAARGVSPFLNSTK